MEVVGPSGVRLYLYILYCICTGNINSCGICKDRITGLLDSLSDYFQIDVHSATCRSLKEFQHYIFQSTVFVKFVWVCGNWFSTFPCSHRQQLLRENLNWFLIFFYNWRKLSSAKLLFILADMPVMQDMHAVSRELTFWVTLVWNYYSSSNHNVTGLFLWKHFDMSQVQIIKEIVAKLHLVASNSGCCWCHNSLRHLNRPQLHKNLKVHLKYWGSISQE